MNLEDAINETANYLYNIDGKVIPKQAIAIANLRQIINEEYVSKGKQVSSQLIYDLLKGVL